MRFAIAIRTLMFTQFRFHLSSFIFPILAKCNNALRPKKKVNKSTEIRPSLPREVPSVSNVRGQALSVGPSSRTVLVRFSARFRNSGHVITFLRPCDLLNTDHMMPFWLFPTSSSDQCLANCRGTKMLSRDQHFLKGPEKKPFSTDV